MAGALGRAPRGTRPAGKYLPPHTSPWPKDTEVRSLLSCACVRDSLVREGSRRARLEGDSRRR